MFSTVNIIGYLGLLFIIASFQFDDRKKILGLHIISALFYFVHLLMIGALTGAFMAFFTAVRNFVFIQKTKSQWAKSSSWPFGFIAIFIFGTYLTWAGPISLLPLCGMISGTIARWSTKEKTLRLLALIPSPFWLIYNYSVGSLPAILGESSVFTSNLIGITRFDILKKRKQKEATPGPF